MTNLAITHRHRTDRILFGVATAILLLATPVSGTPQMVDVNYEHATGRLTCRSGASTEGVCLVTLRPKDFVVVQVTSSVGGIFNLEVTRTDKTLQAVPKTVAGGIGLPSGAAAQAGTTPGERAAPLHALTLAAGFNAVSDAFANIQRTLNGSSFHSYGDLRLALEAARQKLVGALNGKPYDADSIASAMKEADPTVSETSVAARLKEVELFRLQASESLVDLSPHAEQLTDREFSLVCNVKTADTRFSGGQRTFIIEVVERRSWAVNATSGFAFSGLTDSNYTTRTIVDTPAAGGTPAVTHNEVAAQPRDSILPEAVLFVNVSPSGSGLDWFAITLGAGVTTGASGRVYAGVSYRFAQVAEFTAGVAGGKVKRLSEGVNRANSGSVDPQVARIDSFHTSLFGALTFRIGS